LRIYTTDTHHRSCIINQIARQIIRRRLIDQRNELASLLKLFELLTEYGLYL